MKLKTLACTIVLTNSIFLSPVAFADMQQHNNKQTMSDKIQNTSQALKSKVLLALHDYSGRVNVRVADNVAYLSGELPSDTDYERVVTLVESMKDINDVDVDRLTVKDSEQPMTDSYITAKAKGALIKKDIFDRDIPSWSIGIETKNGVVYLSGKAKSNKLKMAVVEVVKSIDGVKSIDDQIDIAQ